MDAAEFPFSISEAKFSVKRPSSPYVDTFRPFSPESDRATTYYSANSTFENSSVGSSPVQSLRSFLDLGSKPATPEPFYSPIYRSCWNPLPIEQERYGLRFPYSVEDVAKKPFRKDDPKPIPRVEPGPFLSPVSSPLDDDSSSNASSVESVDGTSAFSSPSVGSLIGDDKPSARVNPKPPTSYYTDPLGMTAHFAYDTAAFFAAYHEEMARQRAIKYEQRYGIPYVHWSIEANQGTLMSYLKRVMGYENDPAWAHVP